MPKIKDFISPIKKGAEFKPYINPKQEKMVLKPYQPSGGKWTKQGGVEYQRGKMPGYVSSDGDAAKKLARIAAIKKAALANKKYNVGTSTAADPGASPALSSLLGYGGGGGGYYEGTSGGGGFSLSDIPSIVWIILAVGAGYWLIKSGGKGKRLF